MILRGGPFDGEAGLFVPPDTAAPIQLVWTGWIERVGFQAWVYEWRGEVEMDRGRTDALVYRPSGRILPADEIPPVIADAAEEWFDAAALMMLYSGYRPEQVFPGV